jgi:hypothetical protein
MFQRMDKLKSSVIKASLVYTVENMVTNKPVSNGHHNWFGYFFPCPKPIVFLACHNQLACAGILEQSRV